LLIIGYVMIDAGCTITQGSSIILYTCHLCVVSSQHGCHGVVLYIQQCLHILHQSTFCLYVKQMEWTTVHWYDMLYGHKLSMRS